MFSECITFYSGLNKCLVTPLETEIISHVDMEEAECLTFLA